MAPRRWKLLASFGLGWQSLHRMRRRGRAEMHHVTGRPRDPSVEEPKSREERALVSKRRRIKDGNHTALESGRFPLTVGLLRRLGLRIGADSNGHCEGMIADVNARRGH